MKLEKIQIKNKIRRMLLGLMFILMLAILFTACGVKQVSKKSQMTPAMSIVKRQEKLIVTADKALKEKEYSKAFRYLQLLRKKFSASPYADDVAYRLAYIHVMADNANPYFDYNRALQAFRQFKKNYPKSIYGSACNNWLKILYLIFNFKQGQNKLQQKNKELRTKILHLEAKNKELEKTLKDLEHAIRRN